MEEIWKVVPGFSRYYASSEGRIWDKITDKEVSQVLSGVPQYYYVNAHNDEGTRRLMRTHRMVAMAFCEGRSEEYDIVDHINRDPHDNRAVNLRWLDHKGNTENREVTIWYDESKTLRDFCRETYVEVDNAYTYIVTRRLRGFTVEEGIEQYEHFLEHGQYSVTAEWEGEEVIFATLCREKGVDYGAASGRLSVGWDSWGAMFNCPPISNYKHSVEFKSDSGVNIWCKSRSAAMEHFKASYDVIERAIEGGWSVDELLTYDYLDTIRQTVLGYTGTITEIAKHFGMTKAMLQTRVSRQGLTLEEAVTMPPQRIKYVLLHGERITLKDLLAKYGVGSREFQKTKANKKLTVVECLEHYGVDLTNVEF